MADRARTPVRTASIVLVAGVLLIAAAQAVAPVAAPLFDSLTVLGPYRYLTPTGSQAGAPTSATVTEPLVDGASPGFNATTTESPPQAQLIAAPGAFQLGPASTLITVTIQPVSAVAPSTVGAFLGNVYRYAVTDQTGLALSPKSGTDVTLVLRVPDATSDGAMAEYSGGAWTRITSSPAGTPGFFIGTAASFGDFAMVAQPGSGIGPLQVSLLVLLVGALLAAIGYLVVRRRRKPEVRPQIRPDLRPARPSNRRTTSSSSRKRRR